MWYPEILIYLILRHLLQNNLTSLKENLNSSIFFFWFLRSVIVWFFVVSTIVFHHCFKKRGIFAYLVNQKGAGPISCWFDFLLCQLFCSFEKEEVHLTAMSNLQHRILPPSFLSECPKEAGFCLWLLHPDPSSRPKSRQVVNMLSMLEIHEFNSSLYAMQTFVQLVENCWEFMLLCWCLFIFFKLMM